MCIQDSRRSYRTYTYTDLCLFRTPVGVTELILIQNLCLFRTPVRVTELRLILQRLNLFEGTRRYHWNYTYFTDTRVPVGTTELNQIHVKTYTDTIVPVGTTELDQRQDLFRYGTYRRQEYP